MKHDYFLNLSRKIAYVITAVIAGICLFISLTAFTACKTVLNAEFHKSLFKKNNIYTEIYDVVSSSLSGFISRLKDNSYDEVEQQIQILHMVKNSITPEMVKINLDSVRDGIFLYFKGERMFLPDIYLNIKPENENSMKVPASGSLKLAAEAITKIDKVNLSVILLYINRSDISDQLLILKFAYYIMNFIPGFSLLVLSFFFITGLILCRKPATAAKWVAVFFFTYAVLGTVFGAGLLIYVYKLMPETMNPLVASLPLKRGLVISYFQDSALPAAIFAIVSAILSAIFALAACKLPVIFSKVFNKKHEDLPLVGTHKMQHVIKTTIYAFLCMIVVLSLSFKLQTFKKDFEMNNFKSAITKIKNANKVTQVISASNEAIYTVYIKLVDNKTGEPIPDVRVDISGKSSISGESYYQSSITDESGTAKFTLDRGRFKSSFVLAHFPSEYQLPSPYFFDLNTPGITTITVKLDAIPEDNTQKWGIIEIEVLDMDNNPVPNLKLSINGIVSAPGNPNSIFSYTNAEGIAVFKVNEGTYNVSFVESKFPPQYLLPLAIEVNAAANSVTRYTIRMVEEKLNEQG